MSTESFGVQTGPDNDEIKIRHLRAEDFPAVQAIDRLITQRVTTWKNVDMYLAGEPLLSFVAERQGEVIGFLLGDVKSFEFGLLQSGWIEAMGIHPAHTRQGLGARLVRAFLHHCRQTGIKSVQILVNRNDEGLRAFFSAVGFVKGELINMEIPLQTA